MKVKFESEIQKDFCEAINCIYTELFTDKVLLYTLNTDLTDINIYGEAESRSYNEPVNLLAHPVLNSVQGEEYNTTSKNKGYILVPMYQFLIKGISADKQSIEYLKKGAIRFNGVVYQIDDIDLLTNIQGMDMVVKFICSEVTTPLITESLPIENGVT